MMFRQTRRYRLPADGARAIFPFLPRVALPELSRQHIDAGQAALVEEGPGIGHDEMVVDDRCFLMV